MFLTFGDAFLDEVGVVDFAIDGCATSSEELHQLGHGVFIVVDEDINDIHAVVGVNVVEVGVEFFFNV